VSTNGGLETAYPKPSSALLLCNGSHFHCFCNSTGSFGGSDEPAMAIEVNVDYESSFSEEDGHGADSLGAILIGTELAASPVSDDCGVGLLDIASRRDGLP
jgi:hypothetical protein